jgi:hypothetical protein
LSSELSGWVSSASSMVPATPASSARNALNVARLQLASLNRRV